MATVCIAHLTELYIEVSCQEIRLTFDGTCFCPMLLHSIPLSKYLTCNCNDLELGQFKVIQGQKFIVPIESPLVVSCLTSIVSNIVSLTVFEIFDVKIL